ncbi:Uncharacterised protein [Bordetella ansorpii]|uniref:Uncharacterized protein n=1 Tax=Bordetella ansorpii TaxID=288768 RepID=A0A157SM63_9BORD|nr:Uncharacterised protein [Bordetella ansorpii]
MPGGSPVLETGAPRTTCPYPRGFSAFPALHGTARCQLRRPKIDAVPGAVPT